MHALVETVVAKRLYLLFVFHLAVFAVVYRLAYVVRYDLDVPQQHVDLYWQTLPLLLAIKITAFGLCGSFRGWWRYVTFSDLTCLLRSATVATLVFTVTDRVLAPLIYDRTVPISVILLDWLLGVIVLGGLRSVYRLSQEGLLPFFRRGDYRRALIVGADRAGVLLANHLHATSRLRYRIVGFLDADPAKRRDRPGGMPVLGPPDDVTAIATAAGVETVLVTAGSVTGKELRRLMERCRAAGATLKVIPALDQLLDGRQRVTIRDVEINDLLRRAPVELDSAAIAGLLRNKVVLVTGAGGSVGSELCRQVLRFEPSTLVLVERAENNLFYVDRELRQAADRTVIQACVGDVLDRRRLAHIFRTHQPEVVFHAAAHKHVPMMEANPGEALKNNVLGTKRVADTAHRHGALAFVMISTDKAVNPTSVMGVSKQLAERYVHALSQRSGTKFVVVRFGNVLGSNGSVVPLFQEQIRRGGPITITHPDMTRYFMTIPEASQLVLQAAAMGRGGEILVLDMGEPVRILDLAKDLIRLSGLTPDDVEIEFTGTRPGEKLYEELYFEDEEMLPTPHPKLSVAYHRPASLAEVQNAIVRLVRLVHSPSDVIHAALREVAHRYSGPKIRAGSVSDGPADAPVAHASGSDSST
jgi:FlaA1/EpsC-like NDP-sugar epimerase